MIKMDQFIWMILNKRKNNTNVFQFFFILSRVKYVSTNLFYISYILFISVISRLPLWLSSYNLNIRTVIIQVNSKIAGMLTFYSSNNFKTHGAKFFF